MSYTRFAIYHIPRGDALADFGAAWLGWDVVRGKAVTHIPVPGLEEVTRSPRKYGFHATLKPPFRLARGMDADDLARAVSDFAATCAPASCDGLVLSRIGGFLALTPVRQTDGIARVADACVSELDRFRAAPDDAELARRRGAGLSPRQEQFLARWGYPYVMEEFRFHMTLTGRLTVKEAARWTEIAAKHLPTLPAPFALDEIGLVGERPDGMFEVVQCCALAG